MTETFMLCEQAAVMARYAKAMQEADPNSHRAVTWDETLVPSIEAMRQQIREEEGGGGMCHIVTEWLWDKYGWARIPVSYLDAAGDVICAGHLVCVLPDGSLLDATADQFGEGKSVLVIKPGDPAYGRYRPEFDDEVNPLAYPETFGDFYWNRVDDFTQQDQLRASRGDGWWLQDPSAYATYLQSQVELGAEFYAHMIAGIRQR